MGQSSEKLVLIGGGGHCKSVMDTLIRCGQYSDIVVTDCEKRAGDTILGYAVAGTDDILPYLYSDGIENAFITVGSIKSTELRRHIYHQVRDIGFSFPGIVDTSAIVSESAKLGKGVFIGKNASVNAEVLIGDFAIINTGAVIEHECQIGDFTHIAVGATVCGGAIIDNDVFVGANATVIQQVRIGRNCIIGAGSIVLADVPENATVVGIWGGI